MELFKIAGEKEGIWIDQPYFAWDVKQCNYLFNAIDVKYFKIP